MRLQVALVVLVLLSLTSAQLYGCNNGCGGGQNMNFQQQQQQMGFNGMMGCNNMNQQQRFMASSLRISHACQTNLPCYKSVITILGDGPFPGMMDVDSVDDFLGMQWPRSRAEVIAEGRRALQWFSGRFGFNLTNLHDDGLLRGAQRMNENGIIFRLWQMPTSFRYRVYAVTTKSESQLMNVHIRSQGWMLNFTRPVWSTGNFTKWIPANSIALFGDYIIHPCGLPDDMDSFTRPCRNILFPDRPAEPIILNFASPYPISTITDPYAFTPINCNFNHPELGSGVGRGMILFDDIGNPAANAHAHHIIKFPARF